MLTFKTVGLKRVPQLIFLPNGMGYFHMDHLSLTNPVFAAYTALPDIRAAVGPDFSLMLDGGVRRGSDIVKAIGMGADGVMLGRAYTYGLAAAGQAGVDRAIETLRREISITLALMGVSSIADLKECGPYLIFQTVTTNAGERR
ncbi:alpha-hydroxy-acid oxidizing protein [Rhizobium ruizarguesonis]